MVVYAKLNLKTFEFERVSAKEYNDYKNKHSKEFKEQKDIIKKYKIDFYNKSEYTVLMNTVNKRLRKDGYLYYEFNSEERFRWLSKVIANDIMDQIESAEGKSNKKKKKNKKSIYNLLY